MQRLAVAEGSSACVYFNLMGVVRESEGGGLREEAAKELFFPRAPPWPGRPIVTGCVPTSLAQLLRLSQSAAEAAPRGRAWEAVRVL